MWHEGAGKSQVGGKSSGTVSIRNDAENAKLHQSSKCNGHFLWKFTYTVYMMTAQRRKRIRDISHRLLSKHVQPQTQYIAWCCCLYLCDCLIGLLSHHRCWGWMSLAPWWQVRVVIYYLFYELQASLQLMLVMMSCFQRLLLYSCRVLVMVPCCCREYLALWLREVMSV